MTRVRFQGFQGDGKSPIIFIRPLAAHAMECSDFQTSSRTEPRRPPVFESHSIKRPNRYRSAKKYSSIVYSKNSNLLQVNDSSFEKSCTLKEIKETMGVGFSIEDVGFSLKEFIERT